MNALHTLDSYSCLKRLPVAALLLVNLLGLTVHASPQLNDAEDRITDQAIQADYATYSDVQARIASHNSNGIAVNDYRLAKAQCWLDVSLHEYTRNDRSNFSQQALNEADKILAALSEGTTPNPAEQTPLINNADKLRDDLWTRLDTLKHDKGFACYGQHIACAEVELVHAGNEHAQQGWRHAKPYIQIVEGLVAKADEIGDSCIPVVVEKPKAVVAPIVKIERIELAADALFKFNKAGVADLLPAGKQQLDELVATLTVDYIELEGIHLTGHTDRLGSDAYNQRLSEQRAHTVKTYLHSQGLNPSLITVAGKGEAEPVVSCGQGRDTTQALTACLQANRRVDVEVSGIKVIAH